MAFETATGIGPSSYSPSGPVRTPSKYCLMLRGKEKALEFFFSSKATTLPNGPGSSLIGGPRTELHTLQNHVSGRWPSIIGGSTHFRWKDLGHPSQHTRSPLPPHEEQKSSLSSYATVSADDYVVWQLVRLQSSSAKTERWVRREF